MYISQMTIENYRTFQHVELFFDEHMNYIVGDNNIGKSNFLRLLKWMTHGYGFEEGDFFDAELPIEVHMTLSSPEGEALHLKVIQHVQEIYPRLFDMDSGESLPLEYMRCLFYIDFQLFDAPRYELTERSAKGMLRILTAYFQEESAEDLEGYLEVRGLPAALTGKEPEQAALSLFQEIFGRTEGVHAPSAIRLKMAVGLLLLAEMAEKKESKAISFEQMVVTDKAGKRYLNLLLSVDEPELHLNPYQQRAILDFCHSVLCNGDYLFEKLVQKFLGVDGLSGQLFVVTHSTDALVNDYRQIIRMYRDEKGLVQAASGAAFHFDTEVEKHLIMHFPEVKEAMYARSAILVEGETEYGSFGGFARTLGVNLDYHGICLINARGESSIEKIACLLRRFHIPPVSLYDQDVEAAHKKKADVFFTSCLCYEMDVAKTCLMGTGRGELDRVIKEVGDGSDMVNASWLKKAAAKYNVPKTRYPPRRLKNLNPRDVSTLSFYYFAWLYGNKGVLIGRAFGNTLTRWNIPMAFVNVIYAAAERAGAPLSALMVGSNR